jgi:hypothetical protein
MRPEQALAAMAAAARLAPFDDTTTWHDALFETGPDGELLSDPDRPDRALLLALAEEYAAAGQHLDTLPDRAHVAWLQEILGVKRLPVVPDRVVAHVTVDPKLAPAVIPLGTVLRGGKDAFGNERRYTTVDALTAHGAALVGVRSLTPGGTEPGRPGVAASAPDFPLAPLSGPNAAHTLRVRSPTLAFSGGTMTVEIQFGSPAHVADLAGATWRWSVSEGVASGLATGIVTSSTVRVTLVDACGSDDGGDPWIECVVPPATPVPEALAFSAVSVRVVERSGVVPEAAFYNEGAVDVTKEFQPFGAVAKRGDAFYLRCDEAFGKATASLTITVTLMQAGGVALSASAGGSGVPQQITTTVQQALAQAKGKLGASWNLIETEYGEILGVFQGSDDASVRWQRRLDGGWHNFGSTAGSFSSVTATLAGPVGSEVASVSGQPGHYVRAFLDQGDFGWTAYQTAVAYFATRAVAGGDPKPTMPTPPVPPIASSVTVSYTTSPTAATGVEAVSGRRRHGMPESGLFRPFRRAVADSGEDGMVAIGLALPDAAIGSTVSIYLTVDSASPCGAADPVDARWEWWAADGWRELPVADASRQLRESGLLRFVAPVGWLLGCADVDAADGRWVRLITSAPERLGVVQDVAVDAVVAEFVSTAADPASDPSPATALPTGAIKGTLSPIVGVKKVTNVASVRGRGPETDPAYLVRASSRARHRDRAIDPWDYEQHVSLAFPEVAAVRCLPHTDGSGNRAPGVVGLVVVPDRPTEPSPRPSVSLVERIRDAMAPLRPVGARVDVLCPLYAPVTVVAAITLRRGLAALTGLEAITSALEQTLHPTSGPPRWGRSLYASSLIAALESQPAVDSVTSFDLRDATGSSVEVVEVDPCRGLYCSSGSHQLTCEEQL